MTRRAPLQKIDADGALAVEADLRRPRAGEHRQIGPQPNDGMEIGRRRRAAFAPARGVVELRDLIEPDAFIVSSVEIVTDGKLPLRRRLDKGPRDRSGIVLLGHLERAGIAMKIIGAADIVFRPAEKRQDLVP